MYNIQFNVITFIFLFYPHFLFFAFIYFFFSLLTNNYTFIAILFNVSSAENNLIFVLLTISQTFRAKTLIIEFVCFQFMHKNLSSEVYKYICVYICFKGFELLIVYNCVYFSFICYLKFVNCVFSSSVYQSPIQILLFWHFGFSFDQGSQFVSGTAR